MALFQKQPDVGQAATLYTTDNDKTLLIVGLGNVGKEYNQTRHNVGFSIIDNFAEKNNFPKWAESKDRKCAETSERVGTSKIILCKPTTFMNKSGEALQLMQNFYKIPNSSTLVVYDEVDIDFGQIRTRVGGSSAGHNGVKSLIDINGDDFGRFRIGVGPKKPKAMELSDFVLAKFPKKDQDQMKLLLTESNSMLSEYCYSNGNLLEETRTYII